jgi:hydroxyacylglutathione hydrolase
MKTWETKSGYKIVKLLSGRSNVFLLSNGDKIILIDTSPKFMWDTLKKRLDSLNINKIDYLILTHTHFDHANNAKRIKENFKALVIVHKDEAKYLSSGEFIIPNGSNLITRTLVNILAKTLAPGLRCEPCQYDLVVDEKFDLNDFGFNAYIMHTPGHTFGSVSVIVDDEIAIVGDTMFGVFKWSVFPPYLQDSKQLIQSWGKLLQTNCSVFIPAHGSANSRSLVEKDYYKRNYEIIS